MCRVAIHQPNFIPWFPFFYKMAMVDKFVLLSTAQFEKNGYQNRFEYKGKWITLPVKSGNFRICDKKLVESFNDGSYGEIDSLSYINQQWIRVLKNTFRIKTELIETNSGLRAEIGATKRLIQIIRQQKGTSYITNPRAKLKYLDEDKIKDAGIEIEYCKVPKHLQRSTFEIIEEYGIEGAIKQLPKRRGNERLCCLEVSSRS